MIAGHRQFKDVGISVALTGLLLSSIGFAFRRKSPSFAQVAPRLFRWFLRAVIACLLALIAVCAFAFGAISLCKCAGELTFQSTKNELVWSQRPAAVLRDACFVGGSSLILAIACSFALVGLWPELQRPKAE
jgi:hypothetical protein